MREYFIHENCGNTIFKKTIIIRIIKSFFCKLDNFDI